MLERAQSRMARRAYCPSSTCCKATAGSRHVTARGIRRRSRAAADARPDAAGVALPAFRCSTSERGRGLETLDPGRRRRGPWTASRGCCYARARSGRCCWSSRISTGSTPRPRRCSTRWSRGCRGQSCCWSTIDQSAATAGATRTTTPSSGSTRSAGERQGVAPPCWATTPTEPLKPLLIAGPRAIRSSWRRASARWSRPARWTANVAPTGCPPDRESGARDCRAVLAARIDRLSARGEAAAPVGRRDRKGRALRDATGHLRAPAVDLRRDSLTSRRPSSSTSSSLFPGWSTRSARADPRGRLRRPAPGAPRRLHARIVRAFERLYPGRDVEHTSWLTLHAFRGEVWDRAVVYLQGSELPSLDGYPERVHGR